MMVGSRLPAVLSQMLGCIALLFSASLAAASASASSCMRCWACAGVSSRFIAALPSGNRSAPGGRGRSHQAKLAVDWGECAWQTEVHQPMVTFLAKERLYQALLK